MTLKKLEKKAYFSIYTFRAHCYFFNNKEDYSNFCMKKYNVEHDMNVLGKCAWHTNSDGINEFTVGVFDETVSTLAHEATHLALFIMDKIGQRLTYDDEVLCYIVEEIVHKLQDKLKTKPL